MKGREASRWASLDSMMSLCTVVLELQPKQKKEKKDMFCWIAVTFDCHILISASLSPSELCPQFIETSSNGYRLLGNAGEWRAYGWAVRKHSEPRPRLSLAHKKITLLSSGELVNQLVKIDWTESWSSSPCNNTQYVAFLLSTKSRSIWKRELTQWLNEFMSECS